MFRVPFFCPWEEFELVMPSLVEDIAAMFFAERCACQPGIRKKNAKAVEVRGRLPEPASVGQAPGATLREEWPASHAHPCFFAVFRESSVHARGKLQHRQDGKAEEHDR